VAIGVQVVVVVAPFTPQVLPTTVDWVVGVVHVVLA